MKARITLLEALEKIETDLKRQIDSEDNNKKKGRDGIGMAKRINKSEEGIRGRASEGKTTIKMGQGTLEIEREMTIKSKKIEKQRILMAAIVARVGSASLKLLTNLPLPAKKRAKISIIDPIILYDYSLR